MALRPSHRKGYLVDDTPAKYKFGYAVMMEKVAIRRHIEENNEVLGLTPIQIAFAVEQEYTRRHENDPTLRQRQAAWGTRAAARPMNQPQFTNEELVYIAEKLLGSNSEIGQSILVKINEVMKSR